MTAPEPPHEEREERVWLAAGALVGVIVAAVLVAVVLVLTNRGAPPSTGAAAAGSTAPPTSAPAPAEPGLGIVSARDDSLRAAEEAAVVLNTLDYRTVQQGLDRWEAVAASPLLDELRGKRAESASTVERTKLATTAKVLAAAVSRVAADAASTDVLVSVEVRETAAKGAPAVRQLRQKLTMTQTAQGWKLSAVATIEPG